MDPTNPTLSDMLDRLYSEVPWARGTVERLRSEGWPPTMCSRPQKGGHWWLQVQTMERAQRRFELAPEALMLLCKGHVQVEFLTAAKKITAENERLETGFVIVTDPEPNARNRLNGIGGSLFTVAWGSSCSDTLMSAIESRLPFHDPFDVRTPVRGRALVGRDREINALVRDVQQHSAIGVFGLRKMGKTTVVNAAMERLDPQPRQPKTDDSQLGVMVVTTDAQTYASEGMAGLCGNLVEQILSRCGLNSRVKTNSPVGALRQAVEESFSHTTMVCIVVDEFDWLFEPEMSYFPDVLGFLLMVRGLCQAYPDQVRFVFIGREPDRINAARIGGRPNPTLNFWRPFWLGPLDRQEADDLLNRLGKRAGLKVGKKVRDTAWQLAAGHPLMTRLYGAAVRRRCIPIMDKGAEANFQADPEAQRAHDDFLRSRDVQEHVNEVRLLLQTVSPPALELLQRMALATPDSQILARSTQEMPEELEVLKHFGLFDGTNGNLQGILAHLLRPPPPRDMTGRAA